ncbi:MAG: hypothetical protein ACE5OY_02530 [Candidatus Bathyarchaeia archaeon]
MAGGSVLIVRPCRDKAGFKATPTKKFHLDLAGTEQLLEKGDGYTVLVSTPHMTVFRSVNSPVEVTIYRSGKMLIKNVRDLEEARDVATTIFRVLSTS